MMLKLLCVFVFVEMVCCASINDDKGDQAPSPFYEVPCLSFGGICLQEDECPDGKQVSVKGLCPLQQDKGVECCYSVGKSAKTCRSKGGQCVPSSWNCPNNLTNRQATDCKNDEQCCMLVH